MIHTVRRVLFTLALGALVAADGYGQAPLSSPPVAQLAAPCAALPGPEGLPCPPPPTTVPVTGFVPSACAAYEDRNGPLLWGDPLLDQPGFPGPGWLASLETQVLKPSYRGFLFAPVTVGTDTHNVNGTFVPLDWTVAPRLDLGYRLGAGFGEFLISYRFLVSEGSGDVPGFVSPVTPDAAATGAGSPLKGGVGGNGEPTFGAAAGLAHVRTRLNLNVIDVLYASHESALGPGWDMRWDAGMRLTGFYLDSRAVAPSLEQRVSSNYLGGGVKAGLGLYRTLALAPGLALGGQVDGAYLLGQMQQSFEEVQTPAGGTPVGGRARTHNGQGVSFVGLQAGFKYVTPWQNGRLRFEGGYLFEYWSSITEANNNAHGNLTGEGVYFRCTYNY